MAHVNAPADFLAVLVEEGIVTSRANTKRLLDDIFGGVDFENKRVLDIGGGIGLFSFYAASLGASKVVCVEPEAEGSSTGVTDVFDRLRSRLPSAPVTLDRRTIQECQRDGDQYDVIIMHASVNHLDEAACIALLKDASSWKQYRNILAGIAAMSGSGARLVVSDCSRYNFFAQLGLKNPMCPNIEWHKHHRPEVWVSLLEEVGYRNARIRWAPPYRLGTLGRIFLANRYAAYFLKSMFHLEMEKT